MAFFDDIDEIDRLLEEIDCTCYEIIGGHQLGCPYGAYLLRKKEKPVVDLIKSFSPQQPRWRELRLDSMKHVHHELFFGVYFVGIVCEKEGRFPKVMYFLGCESETAESVEDGQAKLQAKGLAVEHGEYPR